MKNLWKIDPNPMPTTNQQQEQLTHGLRQCQGEIQRELGLLRPRQVAAKRADTPVNVSSTSPDVQQTHCNFQNERRRMP